MALITKIEVQKRHNDRVNVYLDDEYALSLYLETALKYGLKNNMDITPDRLMSIRMESDEKIATDKAVKYMARGIKSVKTMKDYLIGKGFDTMVVDAVISKLKEYKYLDDRYYAKQYYDAYKSKYGQKKIAFDMLHKGISQKIIDEVFEENENEEDTLSAIKSLANKYMASKEKNLNNTQKLYRYLLSKGFGYDDIKSVVKECQDESWDR